MPNPIVHFEILGKNGAELTKFYSDIFGWSINQVPSGDMDLGGYSLVEPGTGIGGGIGSSAEGQGPESQAVFYIEVNDTDEFLQKIEAMGGKTVAPTMAIPGMVTFAQFADPAGNVIGLVNRAMPPAQ